MSARGKVEPALPQPCAACPWRTENQGTRHPHGWYTKANLKRLWARLRRGEMMTCHPTDPQMEVPEGAKSPPAEAVTHECCGSLVLQQREFMVMQDHKEFGDYRRARPRGLTKHGAGVILERAMFGGTPLGGAAMTKPNLNNPDVGYEPLGEWTPRSDDDA